MVGGMRNVRSLYQRLFHVGEAPEGSRSRRRRRREHSPVTVPPEEEQVQEEEEEEEQVQDEQPQEEGDEEEEEEEEEGGEGSVGSGVPAVYLQEPASLPTIPIPVARRPLVHPEPPKYVTFHFPNTFAYDMFKISIATNNFLNHVGRSSRIIESVGGHQRSVNGILGLLVREHFPGLVMHGGVPEPAYTWKHYESATDDEDLLGRVFANKAERVRAELWVSISRTI
jgi:hypothetical protein